MADTANILLFHVEAGKAQRIEGLCRKLGIRISRVKLSSYSQKLGYLAGISGFRRENSSYAGTEFPSEMMVFSGMNSDMLDCFLEEYKKASIPPIGLKAVLTPHNIFWRAEDFYRELFKEHQFFQKS
ncbi:MAG TPA: DUF3783 domain-containing protein [Lachnospiraceae bacterium]|nr:DUF3783 domain-containing protein [Lachnospiraceae bacterium]